MAKSPSSSGEWDIFRQETDRIKERRIMLEATKDCIPLEGYIEDEGTESGTIRLFPKSSLRKYNAFIRVNKKDVVGVPMPLEAGGERPKSEIRHRLFIKRSALLTASADFSMEDKVLKRGRGIVFERKIKLPKKYVLGPIVSMDPPTDIYIHLYTGSHCEVQLRKISGIHTPFGPVIWDLETIPYYVRLEDDLRLRIEEPVIEVHLLILNGPSEADIHISVIDERGIVSLPSGEIFRSDASNRIEAGLPIGPLAEKSLLHHSREAKDSKVIPGQIVE